MPILFLKNDTTIDISLASEGDASLSLQSSMSSPEYSRYNRCKFFTLQARAKHTFQVVTACTAMG